MWDPSAERSIIPLSHVTSASHPSFLFLPWSSPPPTIRRNPSRRRLVAAGRRDATDADAKSAATRVPRPRTSSPPGPARRVEHGSHKTPVFEGCSGRRGRGRARSGPASPRCSMEVRSRRRRPAGCVAAPSAKGRQRGPGAHIVSVAAESGRRADACGNLDRKLAVWHQHSERRDGTCRLAASFFFFFFLNTVQASKRRWSAGAARNSKMNY